jgi:hypothetical protein
MDDERRLVKEMEGRHAARVIGILDGISSFLRAHGYGNEATAWREEGIWRARVKSSLNSDIKSSLTALNGILNRFLVDQWSERK